MADAEKKGLTVKIDADLHAEVRQYLDAHDMTMAEFVTLALQDELHPKNMMKEGTTIGYMQTHFIDREEESATILKIIKEAQTNTVIITVSESGIGKSSLSQKIINSLQEKLECVTVHTCPINNSIQQKEGYVFDSLFANIYNHYNGEAKNKKSKKRAFKYYFNHKCIKDIRKNIQTDMMNDFFGALSSKITIFFFFLFLLIKRFLHLDYYDIKFDPIRIYQLIPLLKQIVFSNLTPKKAWTYILGFINELNQKISYFIPFLYEIIDWCCELDLILEAQLVLEMVENHLDTNKSELRYCFCFCKVNYMLGQYNKVIDFCLEKKQKTQTIEELFYYYLFLIISFRSLNRYDDMNSIVNIIKSDNSY